VITTLRSPVFLCASALAGGLLLASTAVAMTPPQLSRAAGYSGNPVAGNQGFGVVVEKNAMLGGTDRDRSTAMAACPTNVTLLDGNAVPLPDQKVIPSGSNIKIHLAAGQTNVLHLTGEMLNNIAELNFLDQPSSSGPLLIVVDTTGTGGVLSWHTPNMAGLQKTAIPSLLWNFPDATNITVASGDSIEGTVYAPRAHLTDIDPSNIEGDIIVRSLEHNGGELHYFPFTATIACTTVDPTTSPTPTPTPTPATSPAPPHAPVPSADHSPDTPAPSGDEDVPGAPDHNRHDGGKNDRPGLAASGTDSTQLTAALAAVALSALGAGVLVLVRRGRRRRHG
jgi:choice-of-anchor A domain-containing protein